VITKKISAARRKLPQKISRRRKIAAGKADFEKNFLRRRRVREAKR